MAAHQLMCNEALNIWPLCLSRQASACETSWSKLSIGMPLHHQWHIMPAFCSSGMLMEGLAFLHVLNGHATLWELTKLVGSVGRMLIAPAPSDKPGWSQLLVLPADPHEQLIRSMPTSMLCHVVKQVIAHVWINVCRAIMAPCQGSQQASTPHSLKGIIPFASL